MTAFCPALLDTPINIVPHDFLHLNKLTLLTLILITASFNGQYSSPAQTWILQRTYILITQIMHTHPNLEVSRFCGHPGVPKATNHYPGETLTMLKVAKAPSLATRVHQTCRSLRPLAHALRCTAHCIQKLS